MTEQQDFHALVREIVTDEFPSQRTAFDLDDELVPTLFSTGLVDPGHNSTRAEFQLFEALEKPATMAYVKLATATFTFLNTVFTWIREHQEPVSDEKLAQKWQSQLVKAGLSAEQAKRIATKFISQIKQRIKR